jgi:hypothetical protein
MFIRFLIYGAVGCLMEVLWTGLGTLLKRDFTLRSTTSLWMFFIYGMVVFLEPVFRLIMGWPLVLRGLVYAACITGGEFVTGSLLKRAALCPWDYSATRYHVMGIIRWDYVPAWAVAGLFFERLFWMLV